MEIPVRTRLTEVVQSSEIARIVLGYLLDVSPESVYLEFARTNDALAEEYQLLRNGYRPTNSLNLIHIIQDFFEMKLLIGRFHQQTGHNDSGSSLTQSLKRILGVQSAKKRPLKRRFSNRESFFVIKRSPDVSDCESEMKRGRYSQSPSPSYVLNDDNELIRERNRVEVEKSSEIDPPPRPDTSTSSVQEIRPSSSRQSQPDSSLGDLVSKIESPQVPLKQRLRKRTKKPEKYTELPMEKRPGKKNKVTIISDEKVTDNVIVEEPRPILPANSYFLPTTGLPNFVFWHTIPPTTEPLTQIINIPDQGAQIVDLPSLPALPAVQPVPEEVTSCPAAVEGSQSTPKNTEKPPIHFKSQSTPRRLASHVRCLFNTPSGKLQHTNIGSPIVKVDDASKTPHVRKNAKQCARVLSSASEAVPEDEKMREWLELRACSNSGQWDQHIRGLEREREDLEKASRTPKSRKKVKAKAALDIKAQMLEDALKSAKKAEPAERAEPEKMENLVIEEGQEEEVVEEVVVETATEPILPMGVKSMEKLLSLSMLLETPFKDEFSGQFPSTPRFLIPTNTPAVRPANPDTAIKIPELTTPCFPITPGLKITPERDSPQIGPCNRPTDYSSSSSYYKPDESEDHKIEAIISAARKRPEEEIFIAKTPVKLDNPTLLERVKSFTEEPKELHYNFVFGNEAAEPVEPQEPIEEISSSSSSESSSSSSSSSSSDEEYDEEKDKNWVSPEGETASKMISETGEIRFPLRNWISPKKLLEVTPEVPPEVIKEEPKEIDKPMKKLMNELQEKRLRVLERMKEDQKPPARKRPLAKRIQQKSVPSPAKKKIISPRKSLRTTPTMKTRLTRRKAPFKISPPKEKPKEKVIESKGMLKDYTIPKKVKENPPKRSSYYHEVFGSSSDEEKSPEVKGKTMKNDEEKSKQSVLAMLEDSPEKIEVKNSPPEAAKPPAPIPEAQEPEEGEIEDSDDECYNFQPATTHKELNICHNPLAKVPSFRLEDFNADAMIMKVMLEGESHQLSLCDAVNIYEVQPAKRKKREEPADKKSVRRKSRSEESVEESRKSAIKPKISLKYKDSGPNAKNLAPTQKKLSSPAGVGSLPKLAQNQIDVVLQHIHGSERK